MSIGLGGQTPQSDLNPNSALACLRLGGIDPSVWEHLLPRDTWQAGLCTDEQRHVTRDKARTDFWLIYFAK